MNSENDPSVLLTPTLVLPTSQSSNANKAACTLINTSINVADHAAEQATGSTNAISSDKTTAVSWLCTPKKTFPDPLALQTIREQLERTPGKSCELQSLNLDCPINTTLLSAKIIKDRYLICVQPRHTQHSSFNNTLYTITSSNLQCVDVFTGEQFLCKIINEPVHKVQRAYFQLLQNVNTQCWSNLYGHQLIRPVKEIIELNNKRTYVIQAPHIPTEYENAKHIQMQNFYEDLHTYVRDKRRLNEMEARSLFYQICETVLMCHRNGVILRDLKLKRFYFVDKARTKLQYESLEGSMILEDPNDDLLSDKIGCPLYTAPELLCPHPTYHGKPADMWSLGVMLYTMLVGQYPFYEKGSCNLIALIRHHNVQIPGNLSRSARRLLLDLLNKNYMERITITYTFLAPWLKEQCPLYMYAPIATEDNEDEEGEHDTFPSNWETETS